MPHSSISPVPTGQRTSMISPPPANSMYGANSLSTSPLPGRGSPYHPNNPAYARSVDNPSPGLMYNQMAQPRDQRSPFQQPLGHGSQQPPPQPQVQYSSSPPPPPPPRYVSQQPRGPPAQGLPQRQQQQQQQQQQHSYQQQNNRLQQYPQQSSQYTQQRAGRPPSSQPGRRQQQGYSHPEQQAHPPNMQSQYPNGAGRSMDPNHQRQYQQQQSQYPQHRQQMPPHAPHQPSNNRRQASMQQQQRQLYAPPSQQRQQQVPNQSQPRLMSPPSVTPTTPLQYGHVDELRPNSVSAPQVTTVVSTPLTEAAVPAAGAIASSPTGLQGVTPAIPALSPGAVSTVVSGTGSTQDMSLLSPVPSITVESVGESKTKPSKTARKKRTSRKTTGKLRKTTKKWNRYPLGEHKAVIDSVLSEQDSSDYWLILDCYLSGKLSKWELDRYVYVLLGRDNVKLHNQLFFAILRNATYSTAPPKSVPGASKQRLAAAAAARTGASEVKSRAAAYNRVRVAKMHYKMKPPARKVPRVEYDSISHESMRDPEDPDEFYSRIPPLDNNALSITASDNLAHNTVAHSATEAGSNAFAFWTTLSRWSLAKPRRRKLADSDGANISDDELVRRQRVYRRLASVNRGNHRAPRNAYVADVHDVRSQVLSCAQREDMKGVSEDAVHAITTAVQLRLKDVIRACIVRNGAEKMTKSQLMSALTDPAVAKDEFAYGRRLHADDILSSLQLDDATRVFQSRRRPVPAGTIAVVKDELNFSNNGLYNP
jgi:Transcriptional regulator of RNA polII, SAGA, subunit